MIKIIPVTSKKTVRDFINLPWKIYTNDPHWVPPIKYDVRRMLDKKRHEFYEFGEAEFYLAYKDGRCAGRISAHINRNHNLHFGVKQGFFGFYECIDDPEVAKGLLDAAELWIKEKGMDSVIGPESFTIYDEIGFLVDSGEAHKTDPVVFHVQTPPYYLTQMEDNGYKKEVDWYAFRMGDSRLSCGKTLARYRTRLERNGFQIRKVNMKSFSREVESVKKLFNEGWDDNWGHVPLTDRQFDHLAKFVKLVANPNIIFVAEKDGETVGAIVNIPDINPAVKRMNGRLFPLGWIKLLRAKKKATAIRTFILGVDKRYRNKGLDAALVMETAACWRSYGYTWGDCSIIVETNNHIIRPLIKWDGEIYKTFRLFSKSL